MCTTTHLLIFSRCYEAYEMIILLFCLQHKYLFKSIDLFSTTNLVKTLNKNISQPNDGILKTECHETVVWILFNLNYTPREGDILPIDPGQLVCVSNAYTTQHNTSTFSSWRIFIEDTNQLFVVNLLYI